MGVVCLVLLSLSAFVSAGLISENDARLGNAQHNLGPTEYHLTLTNSEYEQFPEDQVVALSPSSDAQSRSLIADQIKNLLEGGREIVINGSDDIPVLDPFVVDHIGPFVYMITGVRASGNIRNLRVEGLRWYIVDRVTFNPIRLSLGVQVTLPWIITTGSYDASAAVAIINHRAGGNFRVFVNRLVVSVDVRVGTSIFGGGRLFLRELDIKIDIHDTHIQIDGMTGSSLINTFINSFLQSLTQEVIQSQLETVSKTLSEQLFDVINEILKEFTLDDLLG